MGMVHHCAVLLFDDGVSVSYQGEECGVGEGCEVEEVFYGCKRVLFLDGACLSDVCSSPYSFCSISNPPWNLLVS